MLFLPVVVLLAVDAGAPPQAPAPDASPRDPVTQQLLPVDPVTGKPLQIDPKTGVLIIPRDPTTGLPIELVDESGQPLVARDETGQPLPTDKPAVLPQDSLLRPSGIRGVGSFDGSDSTSRGVGTGGTRYHARLGLVEGLTTNALETQDSATKPIVTHPALFTGIEGSFDLLTWTGVTDMMSFRVGGRLQHYVPVDGYTQMDGGTVNASWNGGITLGKRTVATAGVVGTLTSSNSALLTDGPLFQPDPSRLTHVYTLENARVVVSHELSKFWRVAFGADAWLGTTVSAAPLAIPGGGLLYHSGLDYITPEVDVTLNHDFGAADIGSLVVRDSESYVAAVVDYTKPVPTYNGTAWNQSATMLATWTHAFDERLRVTLGGGASVAQAPPLTDQRPVVSPSASTLIVYSRAYWLATVGGSYSYGSVNPRLGFGPSAGGNFTLQGIPYPHGPWNRFALLANGGGSHSTFEAGGGVSTELVQASGGLSARYAVNRWLGVVGGYNAVYTDLIGAPGLGPVVRNIVFLGLSGYFANDGTLPTLEQFAVSINPPG